MHLTRPSDTEVPLFAGLSKAERRSLPRLMTRVRIDAGTVLAQQDSPAREFMIIIEGTATVSRDDRQLATLGPGDFFGEVGLIGSGCRAATVTAQTDVVVEALNRREFTALLDTSPTVARKIVGAAISRLRVLEEAAVGERRGRGTGPGMPTPISL